LKTETAVTKTNEHLVVTQSVI